jgi:putative protease
MEIMAPAGGFQSAVQAFEHGADAVYVGLKSFSARSAAENFTFEELRRIAAYSRAHGTRLYVAMNTIIKDSELPDVIETVHRLSLIGIDGIIVQDLGLASLIRKQFPQLKLHSSTQLAVASSQGVHYLASIGFSRVVLARELTLDEICEIRRQCPDIELKVFIHGALCYSISGMCLASGMLLGRSANRGQCAQICRTYFANEQQNTYAFSTKDLAIGEKITLLEELGIDSVKIEGRMKGTEYAAYTSAYYRSVLDGRTDHEMRLRADVTFSRTQAPGWMMGWSVPDVKGQSHRLTDPAYPGHTGIEAGSIISRHQDSMRVRLFRDISIHDGLQFLIPARDSEHRKEAVSFAVTDIIGPDGKRRSTAQAGTQVMINAPRQARAGLPLTLVSRHDLQLPRVNPRAYPVAHTSVTAHVIIEEHALTCTINIPEIGLTGYSYTAPIVVDGANKPRPIEHILLKALANSKEEYSCTIAEVNTENRTSFDDDHIFIQPKLLKQFRRDLYTGLEKKIYDYIQARTKHILSGFSGQVGPALPDRSAIPETGTVIDGRYILPLDYLSFDQAHTLKEAEEQIKQIRTSHPGMDIVVGIQHVAQIPWYQRQENLQCYVDFYLYCANRFTAQMLQRELPGCIGAYYWIEDAIDINLLRSIPWTIPVTLIDRAFNPPLFNSRACFRRDSLNLPCSSCGKRDHTYHISQNRNRYLVRVKSCRTYLYQDRENRP